MKLLMGCLAAALMMEMASPVVAQAGVLQYRVQALEELTGNSLDKGRALNDAGMVAGVRYHGPDGSISTSEPFLYRDGRVELLGSLGGNYGAATALNRRGDVVGVSQPASGDGVPFIYRDGRMTTLPLPPAAVVGGPLEINAQGQVIGMFQDAAGERLGYLYDGRTSQALGTGLLNEQVRGLNDRGEVIGNYRDIDLWSTGSFVYHDGHVTTLPMLPVTPGNENLLGAADIDNRGRILVNHTDNDGRLPITEVLIYSDGRYTRLDTPNLFVAEAFNERGWVVGTSDYSPDAGPTTLIAGMWRDGRFDMLDDLLRPADAARWHLSTAIAINKRGQIIGEGMLNLNERPVSYIATPVPEPGSWALMAVGLGLLGALASRRQTGRNMGASAAGAASRLPRHPSAQGSRARLTTRQDRLALGPARRRCCAHLERRLFDITCPSAFLHRHEPSQQLRPTSRAALIADASGAPPLLRRFGSAWRTSCSARSSGFLYMESP